VTVGGPCVQATNARTKRLSNEVSGGLLRTMESIILPVCSRLSDG
jgi:hypothetical protein